ncbi:MAG: hypothetical protein IBJ03_10770 [Gemmatimonadaceae bacterium]|nr:hypothetical protein [Gemmatimonadaceae bacterium]
MRIRLAEALMVCIGALMAPMHIATAQAGTGPCAATLPGSTAPRIIVIPFTKEGEDIRTILESDFNRQLAVSQVKKAFDACSLPTIDFHGALAAMKRDGAVAMESERDFRDRLFEQYKADAFVTVAYRPSVSEGLTSVTVLLDSHLTANGLSLATGTERSTRNREPDVSMHVEQAIERVTEEFLASFRNKYDAMQRAGAPVSLTLRVASGSSTRLSSKPQGGAATIADLVEDWATKLAVQGALNIGTATETVLQISELRMPLREADGTPLSPRRVGSRLVSALEARGVRATSSVSNGAIYVDIQ